MIKANLHNFLVVVAIVLVAAVLFGLLNRTPLAKVPLVGQLISLGAKAA